MDNLLNIDLKMIGFSVLIFSYIALIVGAIFANLKPLVWSFQLWMLSMVTLLIDHMGLLNNEPVSKIELHYLIIFSVPLIMCLFGLYKIIKFKRGAVRGKSENGVKILKADYNRLAQSESALFEIAKLLRIEAGGIYKRISENREILTQLKELNAVSFEENNIFWLLDAHHQFLLSLAYWMKDEGLESTDDFAVYGQGHEIDNVAVFEIIAKELDTKSFAAEWLQAKRPYTHAVNQTR